MTKARNGPDTGFPPEADDRFAGPLSREDVAGYVARRLALARGANERRAIASSGIGLIGVASNAAPRPVDIVCDRVAATVSVFAPPPPVPDRRTDNEARRALDRDWMKMAGLAVVAMAVVLIAGVVALGGRRPHSITARQSTMVSAATRPAAMRSGQASTASAVWVVQVGAFSSHDRAQSLVQRLKRSGFPTFEISRAAPNGWLTVVRVGPFRHASEADDAHARLRGIAEVESAFVRSVTSVP